MITETERLSAVEASYSRKRITLNGGICATFTSGFIIEPAVNFPGSIGKAKVITRDGPGEIQLIDHADLNRTSCSLMTHNGIMIDVTSVEL